MSDRSDFWSLYRVEGQALAPVALIAAELAGPLWKLGARWYDFIDDDAVLAIATRARPLAAGPPRSRDRGRRRRSTCRSSSSRASPAPRAARWSRPWPRTGPARSSCSKLRSGPASRCSPAAARSIWTRPSIARAEHITFASARRATGVRALLPADQSGLRGPRGRAAAAGRPQPWRADRPRLARAEPADPVLDQPRLRRGRRRLCRQHRLRPRLPQPARRQMGRRSTWRTASPPPAIWPQTGKADPDAARDPRRQRRRLHHALRADLPRLLQGRRVLVRHRRPRGAAARHPQVREPLPRPAGRPLARGRPRSTGRARRSITPTA